MYDLIFTMLQTLKKQKPLILNLTNTVSVEFVANGLLSLGASPIMTNASAELHDLITLANGVVINIGTLNNEFIALCHEACAMANKLGKPLTLDPVGAGASSYRTNTCLNLLEQHQFNVIRGNASELSALCGSQYTTKGVDSNCDSTAVIEPAKLFSSAHDVVLAISGKTDVVIEGERVEFIERGSSLMPQITGSGCLLTSVSSAFQSTHPNCFVSTSAALTFYSVCGELAAAEARGSGSFKSHFLDALSRMPERVDYDAE